MINFTKEHLNRLTELALIFLFENRTVQSKIGTPLNIMELLHQTTIGSLNDIRLRLTKAIEALENQDEWVADDVTQKKLNSLKESKELVNLLVGYKRYLWEKEERQKKKAELSEKLDSLKESQKTPEERIKEIESQIAELED